MPVAIVVNASADDSVSFDATLTVLAPHVGGVPLYPLRHDDAAGLANLTEQLLAG